MTKINAKILIPEDWSIEKFSNLVYFQEGPGILSSQFTTEGTKFLNIRCIFDDDIKLEECQFIDQKLAFGKYKHFLLDENDLVVSSSGTLGRATFVAKEDLPLMLNTSVIRMRPLNNNFLSRHYLKYYIQSAYFQKEINQLSTGSAQANYGPSHLKKIYFTLPKIYIEQQKIAEVLNKIEDLFKKTDQLIEKYKSIKQGLMQDLFRYGIDEKGLIRSKKTYKFKESPLGSIPEEWKYDTVARKLDIVDYRGKSPNKVKDGIFLVTSKNIKNGKIDYSLSQEFVKVSEYDNVMSRGKPKIGDLLFTTEAPMGEVANVDDGRIALAQRVIKFDGSRNKIDNYFLKYLMMSESFRKQIFSGSTGSTVTGIKGSRLKKVLLLIPEVSEQHMIKEILVSQDLVIEREELFKQKLLSLKQGLMNDLLSGKVRVNKLMN